MCIGNTGRFAAYSFFPFPSLSLSLHSPPPPPPPPGFHVCVREPDSAAEMWWIWMGNQRSARPPVHIFHFAVGCIGGCVGLHWDYAQRVLNASSEITEWFYPENYSWIEWKCNMSRSMLLLLRLTWLSPSQFVHFGKLKHLRKEHKINDMLPRLISFFHPTWLGATLCCWIFKEPCHRWSRSSSLLCLSGPFCWLVYLDWNPSLHSRYSPGWTCTQPSSMDSNRNTPSRATRPSATLSECVCLMSHSAALTHTHTHTHENTRAHTHAHRDTQKTHRHTNSVTNTPYIGTTTQETTSQYPCLPYTTLKSYFLRDCSIKCI